MLISVVNHECYQKDDLVAAFILIFVVFLVVGIFKACTEDN